MRTGRLLSLLALAAGLALLAWAALQGNLRVSLLVVIPVITGEGPHAALGGLLAVAGLFGWMLTAFAPTPPPNRGHDPAKTREGSLSDDQETRSAGILLIGPIPVAWGSDKKTLLILIGATVVLIAAATALLWILNT